MKKIPYKTVWVEYPDIEATMKNAGIAHTSIEDDGSLLFTCPAIIDPEPGDTGGIVGQSDGNDPPVAMADSFPIAEYLDKKHPIPEIFPHGTLALQRSFILFWAKELFNSKELSHLIMALAHNQLPPRSQEFFRRTREVWLGMKLEAVLPPGAQREKEIEGVREAFNKFDKLLANTRSHAKDAQLVMEGQTIYADIVIASWLMWIRCVAAEELWWNHFAKWNDGRWETFVSAMLEKYGQVDA
jgi:glutathione S-transferase